MDQDLVIRAQQGDQRAFELLVSQNYASLQKAAVGILRDRHVAEDATQTSTSASRRGRRQSALLSEGPGA